MPACGGGEVSTGPPPWASLPFSSARAFRDRHDDQSNANRSENNRATGVDQPSYPVARVWPISNLCKGGPAAPAFGGYGLDRACRPATVSHQGIDGDVRLIRDTNTLQPSQRSLTQNIGHSPMGVTGEIAQHLLRPCERSLAVDDPLNAPQRGDEALERSLVGKSGKAVEERQLIGVVRSHEHRQQ